MLLKSSFNTKTNNHVQVRTCRQQSKNLTVLHYPPHCPDFGFSDLHLFGALKRAVRQKRFGSEDEVIEEVIESTKFGPVQEGDRRAAC
jgi:hypothetical protein